MPEPVLPVASAVGSTVERLCAELIALRERNDRQHKIFEQALSQTRDDLQGRFDQFVTETQQAYQRFREDLTGEKRLSIALLSALLDLTLDLQRVAEARPPLNGPPQSLCEWSEGVCAATRKAQSVLMQFGVHRYDAIVGMEYEPAWHERVGCQRIEGFGPHRVAVQIESGFASRQPEFVLRRAKVLITE